MSRHDLMALYLSRGFAAAAQNIGYILMSNDAADLLAWWRLYDADQFNFRRMSKEHFVAREPRP